MLIEIGFNVAGTRIVAFMNDISVWWHIGLVVAIAVALFALGSQPTHPFDFLFTDRAGRHERRGHAVGRSRPVRDRRAPSP